MERLAYSQATEAGGYLPQPRRFLDQKVEVGLKMRTVLPSGATYTIYEPCSAWGAEDIFGQRLRAKDRKRQSGELQ